MMQPKNSKSVKKETVTVHIEMSVDLERWIRKLAEQEDRSMRKMVLNLLKEAKRLRESQ
jgi:predicted transposase YbfD/YdcC